MRYFPEGSDGGMGNIEPEIQVSVATGISGLFASMLFGNTDFDLCPPLFEKGDNDVIQTVIVERKITDIFARQRISGRGGAW